MSIPTPFSLGFRYPAEWEPHEATWIGWPHNTSDWPGKFSPIPWVYAEIVRKLSPGELVRVIVRSARHEQRARAILQRAGVDLARTEFFRFPTDRGWTRDFGPLFISRSGSNPKLALAGFRFSGWAKYQNWKQDARVQPRVAKSLGIVLYEAKLDGYHVVLEGGAIDTNGRGTLITTEECLLDDTTQVRNPGLQRGQLESALREYLGVTNVLWLGRGIAGDDTHGHVDDLCRFVGPRTLILCHEEDRNDPNYVPLRENFERLQSMHAEDGSSLEVIALPMPSPLLFNGVRLPASYANFYIGNRVVLVPTFNDPKDRQALGVLQELFPDRTVTGIHASDLVWGLGTLHCLTHEQPAI